MMQIQLFASEEVIPARPDAASDEWFTPQPILDALPFVLLDPCFSPLSHVIARHTLNIRRGQDGKTADWAALVELMPLLPPWSRVGIVFVNPPYSDCAAWVALVAAWAKLLRVPIIMLIPAIPGEVYWHANIWGQARWVAFLNGRVKHDTAAGIGKGAGNFSSALVCFDHHGYGARLALEHVRSNSPRAGLSSYIVDARAQADLSSIKAGA